MAGGWKVDGRRKKKIQRRRLRKKDENMRPGPWEVGGNYYFLGVTLSVTGVHSACCQGVMT